MEEKEIKKGKKTPKEAVGKEQPALPTAIIINDFTTVSPDRTPMDAGKLRSAIQLAESESLPNRSKLYDIYHNCITLDGHLSGILTKRRDSIRNKTIRFVDEKGGRVEAFDRLINSEPFYNLLGAIIDSVYWGISGVQFVAGEKFNFVEIPRKHIRPERCEVVRYQYDTEGIPVSDISGAWLIGKPRDLGALLTCSLYSIYKRGGFGDFSQYVEIFGQPVRVAKYDAYDTKTRDELRKMCEKAGASLVMMLPKQADFEMLDGKTSNGNGELQRSFIAACNEEMSIAILGNSETTTSSASSGYAQAKEHGKQQQEIIRADMRLIENTLNSPFFFSILTAYGYPVKGGRFEFEHEADLTALTQRINIDMQVSQIIPLDDDYWYNTYGYPKPENYEELRRELDERKQAALDALRRSSGGNDTEAPDGEDTQQEQQERAERRKEKNRARDNANKSKNLADLLSFFGVAPQEGA